jgi:hypothetical protein
MLQQLVLIVIALLYLQKKSVSSLTYEHVAFLLLLAYLMRQSFRVEHLSAADGFTTDIDKEAYTNLHKIVSELYKNDTLTIPGHLHVKGNLHVGDAAPVAIKAKNPNSGHTHIQGNLQVGSKGLVTKEGSALTEGAIYGAWVRSRHIDPNGAIDTKNVDIFSGEKLTIHPHIHCNSIQSNTWVHTDTLKVKDIVGRGQEMKMWLNNKDGNSPVWKTLRGNGKSMYLA